MKTGIGALLNTGTVIDAGSNLDGNRDAAEVRAAVQLGQRIGLTAFDADKSLQVTTETVMKPRSLVLSGGMREMLRRAWCVGREQA